MYNWYRNSAVCYAFLSDFENSEVKDGYWWDDIIPRTTLNNLTTCRWFSRGWTLQELLSPPGVEFYDQNWVRFGTRAGLQRSLSLITGIPVPVLSHEERPHEYPVAARMSWACLRTTTRKEDEAYCLMGLFNIYMPLLYGEGERAFQRLQEEILQQEEDYSIFAWTYIYGKGEGGSIFASSPTQFHDRYRDPFTFKSLRNIHPTWNHDENVRESARQAPTISSRGLSLDLPLLHMPPLTLAAVCQMQDSGKFVCIVLQEDRGQVMRSDVTSFEDFPLLSSVNDAQFELGLLILDDLQGFQRGVVEVATRIRFESRHIDDFLLEVRTKKAADDLIERVCPAFARVIMGKQVSHYKRSTHFPSLETDAAVFFPEGEDEDEELYGSALMIGIADRTPWFSVQTSQPLSLFAGDTRGTGKYQKDTGIWSDVRQLQVQTETSRIGLVASLRRIGPALWPPLEQVDPDGEWRMRQQKKHSRLLLEIDIDPSKEQILEPELSAENNAAATSVATPDIIAPDHS